MSARCLLPVGALEVGRSARVPKSRVGEASEGDGWAADWAEGTVVRQWGVIGGGGGGVFLVLLTAAVRPFLVAAPHACLGQVWWGGALDVQIDIKLET